MCIPVCKHRLHVHCALRACQYDLRCPVCRTIDPSLQNKESDTEYDLLTQLQQIAEEQQHVVRQYRRRRSALIRKRESLRKMRDRQTQTTRSLVRKTTELEQEWLKRQKLLWMNDPCIQRIKQERRRCQRRARAAERKLNLRVHAVIGVPPIGWT
jgi:DNA repair exonuclease SbcCD ATPase subunit